MKRIFYYIKTKKENYEPDFIRRHKFYEFNNEANLLEIKLPKEKFIVRKNFHAYPSTTLMGHLSQVKDYKRYFLDSKNKNTIIAQLDFLPKMSHSLLLGRSSERDYHLEDLEKRMRDFNFADIALITYDDLIKKRIDLLEQRQMFRIQSS